MITTFIFWYQLSGIQFTQIYVCKLMHPKTFKNGNKYISQEIKIHFLKKKIKNKGSYIFIYLSQ